MRGDITQTPKNVATKVRQRVTLPCAGVGVLEWTMFLFADVAQYITYFGKVFDRFKDRFSLNTDGDQFTLVIMSTVLSDGKTFRCFDVINTHEHHGDAEVIVFGKTYFPIFHRPATNFLNR